MPHRNSPSKKRISSSAKIQQAILNGYNVITRNPYGRFAPKPKRTSCQIVLDNYKKITPERKRKLDTSLSKIEGHIDDVTFLNDAVGVPYALVNSPKRTKLEFTGETKITYLSSEEKNPDGSRLQKVARVLTFEDCTTSVASNPSPNSSPVKLNKALKPKSKKTVIGPVELTKNDLEHASKERSDSQFKLMGYNSANTVAKHHGLLPPSGRCEWAHLWPHSYGLIKIKVNKNKVKLKDPQHPKNLFATSKEYNTDVMNLEELVKFLLKKGFISKVSLTLKAESAEDSKGNLTKIAKKMGFKFSANNVIFKRKYRPMEYTKTPTQTTRQYLTPIAVNFLSYKP